jgi:hypothetical protein
MVAATRRRTPEEQLEEAFPIYAPQDCAHWHGLGTSAVGFRANAPEKLKRMAVAGAICFGLGNKSIDNVYKNYVDKSEADESVGDRADEFLLQYFDDLEIHIQAVLQVRTKNVANYGTMIGGWTLLRVPFSIKMALMIANRGAIFECSSLVRSILEQLAWCHAIQNIDDITAIQKLSATNAMTNFKDVFSSAGKFYGWLSKYAHWAYDSHAQFFTADSDKIYHLFGNSQLKLRGYTAIFAVSEAQVAVLKMLAGELPECQKQLVEFSNWHSKNRSRSFKILESWSEQDAESAELISLLN